MDTFQNPECSMDGEKPAMCPSVWWCGCYVSPSLLFLTILPFPFPFISSFSCSGTEIGKILTEWNVLVYGLKKISQCVFASLSLPFSLSLQSM